MHKSVLLQECLENLNVREDGIYVDCTLGYGGHSNEILKRLTTGHLYAFDQDEDAIQYSQNLLAKTSANFTIIYSNFENLKQKLVELNVDKVDGILFDLGFSSPQIDEASRGFSFMQDAPLDMRMDKQQKLSAYEVVNHYEEKQLTDIFYRYAEEKYAKSIAQNIVRNRPLNTTLELVEVIKKSVPYKYFLSRHPERVIFQALRIEVNRELFVLEKTIPDAIELLKPHGRMCVITFHSLEDRIVKHAFKEASEVPDIVKGLPNIPSEFQPKIILINKKPILPSTNECAQNSRAKSAKLRVIERV